MMKLSNDSSLLALAAISPEDLVANRIAIEAGRVAGNPGRVCTWLLPVVTHALKGGVRTVFMLAQEFSRRRGTLNIFVIYSFTGRDVDTRALSESLRQYFPDLRFVVQTLRRGVDDIDALPASDFAFCTLWTTAYVLLKYNRTRFKYYLMQDYEPLFYAAGSVYSVIEHTYRFGFSCIANTPGVGSQYKRYSDDMVSFLPGVDHQLFRPEPGKQAPSIPSQVVFYGRPSNARNCFDLGIMTLVELKKRLGDTVRIVSVGENWDPATYGLEGIVENLGLLSSMAEVADLYRRSDIGLVYMVTPHPSYQPLEYMAAGCVVATNINDANDWLLNEGNSIRIPPAPEVAAEQIAGVLRDSKRWVALRERAFAEIGELSWSRAFNVVFDRVLPAT